MMNAFKKIGRPVKARKPQTATRVSCRSVGFDSPSSHWSGHCWFQTISNMIQGPVSFGPWMIIPNWLRMSGGNGRAQAPSHSWRSGWRNSLKMSWNNWSLMSKPRAKPQGPDGAMHFLCCSRDILLLDIAGWSIQWWFWWQEMVRYVK